MKDIKCQWGFPDYDRGVWEFACSLMSKKCNKVQLRFFSRLLGTLAWVIFVIICCTFTYFAKEITQCPFFFLSTTWPVQVGLSTALMQSWHWKSLFTVSAVYKMLCSLAVLNPTLIIPTGMYISLSFFFSFHFNPKKEADLDPAVPLTGLKPPLIIWLYQAAFPLLQCWGSLFLWSTNWAGTGWFSSS